MKWTDMNNITRQECIRACLENNITYNEMDKAWQCGKNTVRCWYRDNKDKDFSNEILGQKRTSKKSVKEVCEKLLGDKYEE